MEEMSEEQNPTAHLYGAVLSVVEDYLGDSEVDIRNAAVKFVREVSVNNVFCKAVTQQIMWRSESDKIVERHRAMTVMVALLFQPSPLLSEVLRFIEHEHERVRQAAITCLSEHVHEKQHVDTSHKFYAMMESVKAFMAQVVSDVMISDVRCPTLHMYTETSESVTTKTAAFVLLYHARYVSHEAVCNAVLALEHSDEALLSAATAYLTLAALVCDAADKRSPALSALSCLPYHAPLSSLTVCSADARQRGPDWPAHHGDGDSHQAPRRVPGAGPDASRYHSSHTSD